MKGAYLMSKLKDLKGQKFGKLLVISRADNYKDGRTRWKCQCDCGNIIDVMSTNLLRGNTKSCGCYSGEYISKSKVNDLTGKRYGKLTVLYRVDKRGKNSCWYCKCDCGVEKEISAVALKHGQKSCGCSMYDCAKDKIIGNEYSIDENNVVHVVLRDGEEMLCDIDDWNCLKEFTWRKNRGGYATSSINRKQRRFHKMVMGKRDGYVVDHIDRNKLNNQKSNLRFVTHQANSVNIDLPKNNTSGIIGVSWLENRKKWTSRLTIDGKNIFLGNYDTKEEAEEARKKAEEKYFKPLFEEN